ISLDLSNSRNIHHSGLFLFSLFFHHEETPTMSYIDKTEVAQYIHGQRTAGSGSRTQPIYNPATGAVARLVRLGNVQDVDAAVASAQAAFPKWSDTPPIRRARVLFKFLELLNQNKDALAHMITAEHGKVFTDAQGQGTPG